MSSTLQDVLNRLLATANETVDQTNVYNTLKSEVRMLDIKNFRRNLLADLREIGITPKTNQIIKGKQYIAYLNTLRGLKGVMASLHQEFDQYHNIEIVDVWIRFTEVSCTTPFGLASYLKPEILLNEPIISCDFTHVVAIHSDDNNMLEYVKWSIEKHLSGINALKALEGKIMNIPDEDTKEPKLKSLEKQDVEQFVQELFSNIHF